MRLVFIWVGKTRNRQWAALEQEYLARIRHFAPCRLHIVREAKGSNRPGETQKLMEQEGKAIVKSLDAKEYVVLLDERGKLLTSRELAAFIEQRQIEGKQQMSFIIGGASGVAEAVSQRADVSLSLSPLTLPHEMARVILLEQIYRSFAIIHNLPYPK